MATMTTTMPVTPLSPAGGPFAKKIHATFTVQGPGTFVFTPSDDLLPILNRKTKYPMLVYHCHNSCQPAKVMPMGNGEWKIVALNVPRFKCGPLEVEVTLLIWNRELGKILGRADLGTVTLDRMGEGRYIGSSC
jgi:hypothetical protein